MRSRASLLTPGILFFHPYLVQNYNPALLDYKETSFSDGRKVSLLQNF